VNHQQFPVSGLKTAASIKSGGMGKMQRVPFGGPALKWLPGSVGDAGQHRKSTLLRRSGQTGGVQAAGK